MMRRPPLPAAPLLALLLLLSAPAAGAPEGGGEEGAGPAPAPAAEEESHSVRAGDTLDVSVFNHQELSRVVPVQPDGSVVLPFLGRIAARGRSVEALSAEIAASLERDYKLREPRVSVSVASSTRRTVFILGRVRLAGSHDLPASRPLTLLHLFSLVGGFEEDADRTRIRVRRVGPGGDISNLTVDLSSVEQDGDMGNDVALSDGDTVLVPRVEEVSVLGMVARPGNFVIRSGESLTLLRAVARAEGFTRLAKISAVLLIRKGGRDSKPLRVDAELILDGRVPDPVLEPGDIVYVPERAF